MAACIEFKKSPSFPEKSELQKCKRATGHHNEILLAKFKKWVSCNKQDAYFRYYLQMFTLFGPLQQMYLTAVKYGDGRGLGSGSGLVVLKVRIIMNLRSSHNSG